MGKIKAASFGVGIIGSAAAKFILEEKKRSTSWRLNGTSVGTRTSSSPTPSGTCPPGGYWSWRG
ncbi:MAG: hypothetical protein JRN13_07310 [Nitrososphaerota archaeon]|nr:hypothetical protein [Nitrososphaerota archaeon]